MAQDRCPRCNNLVERDVVRCPSCDLHLHYRSEAKEESGEEKGRSFLGWPRFLQKHEPDWAAPEVSLHRPWRPIWLSYLVAGLLIAAYRAPLLHMWNHLIGKTDEEISVKIVPDSEIVSPSPALTATEASSAGGSLLAAPHWIFSGIVYDLLTMKPVPRTTLVFEDVGSNRRYTTSSKNSGHFKIRLPEASTEGYYLKVQHRGYLTRVLFEDGRTPRRLRFLSLSKRKGSCRDFARTIEMSKPISPAEDAGPLNLFLVPINPS